MMGATLPLLSKYLVEDQGTFGRRVGGLYALNTFGAVLGCVLAGFVLIGALGLKHSTALAGVLNVGIGAGSLVLWQVRGRRSEHATELGQETGVTLSLRTWLIVAVYGACGFASLAAEVIWTRLLLPFTGSTTYAFTVMLATMLFGLALGSLIGRTVLTKPRASLAVFAALEAGIGVLLVAMLMLLVHWTGPVYDLMRRVAAGSRFGLVAGMWLPCWLLALGPATLMGAAFPLAAHAAFAGLRRVGASVGVVSSANTFGAIFGSYAAGFIMLPTLGATASLAIVASINVVAAGCLLALERSLSPVLRGVGCVLIAALAVAVGSARPRSTAEKAILHNDEAAKMLYVDEDIVGTVVVTEESNSLNPRFRRLTVGGNSLSATTLLARRYMKLLAHVPILLHESPRRVLVMCLGTGMTLGAAARHGRVESVACVELSPGVVKAAPYFDQHNLGALDNPKVSLIVADARNHILRTSQRYDVITAEPPPPTSAGTVNLYSFEFYELCKERLAPGGIVCQWVPLHNLTDRDVRMLFRAFVAAFPRTTVWVPVKREVILVGAVGDGKSKGIDSLIPSTEQLASRMSEPAVAEDLASIGFGSPAALFACVLATPQAVAAYTDGVPPVTDDRPSIEFFRIWNRDRQALDLTRFFAMESERGQIRDFLGRQADPEGRAELEREFAAMEHIWRAACAEDAGAGEHMWAELHAARRARPDSLYVQYLLGISPEVEESVRRAVAEHPRDPSTHLRLGRLLMAKGEPAQAVEEFEAAVALRPDFVDAHFALGGLHARYTGRRQEALLHLRRVVELVPQHPMAAQARRMIASLETPAGRDR